MENENTEASTPTINISNDELREMYMTGIYNAGIVKSVSCKRRGRNVVLEFALTDGKTVTMNY